MIRLRTVIPSLDNVEVYNANFSSVKTTLRHKNKKTNSSENYPSSSLARHDI